MTTRRLLIQNLFFHWRGNFAVLLGVAVGTAALTGALLVGDSLRGSLRDRTLRQLGWVEQALVGGRFIRADLATEVGVAPALLLRGSARPASDGRGIQAAILGVDERFWRNRAVPVSGDFWASKEPAVVLPAEVADELKVTTGDTIRLRLQKASKIHRETTLGRRSGDDLSTETAFQVAAVLPTDDAAGAFTLNPMAAGATRNVFVPLPALQEAVGQVGRANALLAAGPVADFRKHLSLDDWGLFVIGPKDRVARLLAVLDRNKDGSLQRGEYTGRIAVELAKDADTDGDRTLSGEELLAYFTKRGYFVLESRSLLIEPSVLPAVRAAIADAGLRSAEGLVYLANRIREGDASIPYSVVAALDPSEAAPLGPFLPDGVKLLADDQIILAGWGDSPLPMKPGAAVTLEYFRPESEGKLVEDRTTFKLAGVVPMSGPAADPDLTPEFPGITDKVSLDDWDPPFPYDNKRVGPKDEKFWQDWRATPKAYVTLARGQQLWGSRFGNVTSIRLASRSQGSDLDAAAADFRARLLKHLDPDAAGLAFEPVRDRALNASRGGTDFGLLFLGFSLFLIAAAVVLVGLLVRLNLDQRAAEVGVLLAAGFRVAAVRRLLLWEGLVLTTLGGLLGLAGAIGYAWLMLRLLVRLWPDDAIRSFLTLHVGGLSLGIGFVAALAVSVGTIFWAVRVLGKASPRSLLAGEPVAAEAGLKPASRWSGTLALGALVLAVGLAVAGGFVHDAEARAGTFFGGGALLLTAALAAAWTWLKRDRREPVRGVGTWALARLGARNAGRNPTRSLLTAALLASAAFLLVAVESFRRRPEADFAQKTGGSGGFSLIAEAELPIFQGLNDGPGRDELFDTLERAFRKQPAEGPAAEQLARAKSTLDGVTFIPLRVKPGDDASCLNLYAAKRPKLLGAPPALIERGGFQFAQTEAATPEEKANPWLLLTKDHGPGVVPVFGEMESVQWILGSGLGRENLTVPDAAGHPIKLRIVGLLKDSAFQGELITSEAALLRIDPEREGYGLFLIDAPAEKENEVARLVEEGLAAHGVAVTPSRERVAAYLAVVGTYLSTFQVLGGFGLLLGAVGLAVVLLRGVWERRGELALLRALGYRARALGWLVLAENAFLLLLGLAAGVGAALLAVAPHLAGGGLPIARLSATLGLVLAAGLLAGAAAVWATLKAPLLPALRRE